MRSRLPADQLPGSPASVPTAEAHGAVPRGLTVAGPGIRRRAAPTRTRLSPPRPGGRQRWTRPLTHPAPDRLTPGSTPQPVRPVRGFHWRVASGAFPDSPIQKQEVLRLREPRDSAGRRVRGAERAGGGGGTLGRGPGAAR